MQWNDHYGLRGKHAFMSASSYHWVNYDTDKLEKTYLNLKKKEEGTKLHALAATCIETRTKLAPLKKALHSFVNDAIAYRMQAEVILVYSDNCFGTADAILYSEEDKLLRIHDLKTGQTPASYVQLDVYAAIFCLEYHVNPKKIRIEERIYQGRDFTINEPDPNDISMLMKKIVEFDKVIDQLKSIS